MDGEDGSGRSGPAAAAPRQQRPETRLTALFVATAVVLGLVGSAIGSLALADLSGVPIPQGPSLFAAHPYLQLDGFIAEFVVGVAYSLTPRFKVGRLPSVFLGYVVYALLTSANLFHIVSATSGRAGFPDALASALTLLGSLLFAYQVFKLVGRAAGGFPEADPMMMLSSASLVLASLLPVFGPAAANDAFSPGPLLLILLGFAGSEIYAVQIRSVSFRQCDYRKRAARLASAFQASAVASTFLAAVFPSQALSVLGAVLFFAASVGVLVTIKILELAHPLMFRPSMTRTHFSIMRYNEACLLSAAAWLLLGGAMGVAWVWSGTDAFFVMDSFIHSVAIGFVGSNIICFGPMLLPGLLGRRGPVTGLSYGPMALLDAGVLIRLAGDVQSLWTPSLPVWESLSGPAVMAAMVWFLVMLRGVGRRPSGQAIASARDAAEVRLTVVGRKTGREISMPLWFVERDGAVCLLPGRGRSTQWYRNLLANPAAKLSVGGVTLAGTARPVPREDRVRAIAGLFRDKYGDRNYRNYYGDRVDVAVEFVPA
ncbi:MAG: nitroreductase family deazaflavin-dependent oxidoreductase [Nitrososphaerota archaeon]|nr:nitroreductase family deazaflavin-dependent oxidoreductase [Nitrososphaerota archaeon]